MTENSDDWAISVCGLNCAKCDMYEASHGNDELRKEIVKWFEKERNETVRLEQIRCDGCSAALDAHWSPDCKMMLCAREKGLRYCFQCEEFPCELLKEFRSDGTPHHKRTVQNLERMKEIGLTQWIAEQRKEGKCEFCP